MEAISTIYQSRRADDPDQLVPTLAAANARLTREPLPGRQHLGWAARSCPNARRLS
jgi:hypothetical protein